MRPAQRCSKHRKPIVQPQLKQCRYISQRKRIINDDAHLKIEAIARNLNINHPEQWYNVTKEQFIQHGGEEILKKYQGSVALALITLIPQHKWKPWLFITAPPNYWTDIKHQRAFMDWLKSQLGIKSMSGWYDVTRSAIAKNYGASLLRRYNDSAFKLITSVYNNHNWEPWKFKVLPADWWNSIQNQRSFLLHVQSKLNLKSLHDFYQIEPKQLDSLGGKPLLDRYGHDIFAIMTNVFKEHQWLPWKFSQQRPREWWLDSNNLRWFLETFASNRTPHISSLDEWYTVSDAELRQYERGVYDHYTSLVGMLVAAYPHHQWEQWKFIDLDKSVWEEIAYSRNRELRTRALQQLFDSVGTRLKVSSLSDWYRVSRRQLHDLLKVINLFGGLALALKEAYPYHSWDPDLFQLPTKRSTQRLLAEFLQLWGANNVTEGVRIDASHKTVNATLELDIYVEPLRLALEYQGPHHYFDVLLYGDQIKAQDTDIDKALACSFRNISLIEVPFWWEDSYDRLVIVLSKICGERQHNPPTPQLNN